MSKASQRRLADLQKRVEKLKKKSPHMKALVELEEMDPEDVFSNPVRYWSRLLNAMRADEPHDQHALLESAFEVHSAFFECLHDAVLFEQADMFLFTEPPMLPGFVLGIDGDGMGAGFTAQSPLFTPAAPEGIPWATHFADLQLRTGQCVFRSLLDTHFGFSWTAGTAGDGHPVRHSWTRTMCCQ